MKSTPIRFPSALLPALLLAAAPSLALAQVQLGSRWATQMPGLVGSIPPETNDFAAGDVDGDGDLDLVLVTNRDGALLLSNRGDGSFDAGVRLGTATRFRTVVLRDFDGDGQIDVFLGGGGTAYQGNPSACELHRNDGGANFKPVTTLPTVAGQAQLLNVVCLCPGDLDGDGDLDLVLCPSNAPLQIWQNNGSGTFVDVTAGVLPGSVGAPRARLADLDGDGDLDLVLGPIYLNDGNGVFAAAPGLVFPIREVADLDGDGDPDLVTFAQVLRNDGALTFTPVGALPGGFVSLFLNERLVVADLDLDGNVDLLGIDAAETPRFLHDTGGFVFQDTTASHFEPHALVDESQGYTHGACLAFDADGDGDLDFVTGAAESRAATSNTVGVPPRLFLNVERAHFVHASRGGFPWLQSTATTIAAGDADGDGTVDLLFSFLGYTSANSLWGTALYRQEGAGRYAAEPSMVFGDAVSAAVLVDVDGDGDLDVFGAAGHGPELLAPPALHKLALNDGTGTFTDVSAARLPATAMTSGASCAAGDIDGDGDQDLVVGSYDPNGGFVPVPLLLLRNDGTGTFTDASAQLPPNAANARWVALRDLDGDGDLDLLVTDGRFSFQSGTTLCFRNDGGGIFTDVTAARMPAVVGWGLDVRDLDGDGDLDVAQAGATLWNDGSGTFTSTPAAVDRLLAADFDGDGVADDVRSQFGQQLVVGSQTIPFGLNVKQHLAHAVDLDGDGDLDLVASCLLGYADPNLSQVPVQVFWNRTRDLEAAALPRIDRPYRLRVRGHTGPLGTWTVLATSTAVLPQPVTVPGIAGAIVVDPGQVLLWYPAFLPSSTTTLTGAMDLPSATGLLGQVVTTQAVFVPVDGSPIGLSNALSHHLDF